MAQSRVAIGWDWSRDVGGGCWVREIKSFKIKTTEDSRTTDVCHVRSEKNDAQVKST